MPVAVRRHMGYSQLSFGDHASRSPGAHSSVPVGFQCNLELGRPARLKRPGGFRSLCLQFLMMRTAMGIEAPSSTLCKDKQPLTAHIWKA
jgi:hypothetical protein